MTVYVDNVRIPARVGRINARWSHLFADTQDELHEFAAAIGLKRAWFQSGKPIGGKPSRHWHYDVTDSMRERAIRAGARPVDMREYAGIVAARETSKVPPEAMCPTCNGAKVIIDTSEDTDISPMKTCPTCNGTGKA